MLLPTPRVLVVVVGVCFLVLFAVNSLNAGTRAHDWHSSSTTTTPIDPPAHEDKPHGSTSQQNSLHRFKEMMASGMRVALAKTSSRIRPPQREKSLQSRLQECFAPIVHTNLTAPYLAPDGRVSEVGDVGNAVWRERLGRKILIVDIDTRVPDGANQILSDKRIDYDANPFQSGGDLVTNAVFDHYLYAQIHNYTYLFYQAHPIPSHHPTWILPSTLLTLLASHNYTHIVTMDADVSITHPELPLEWLFNRWGITKHTSIAMPWDVTELGNSPDDPPKSVDGKGVQVLNTGLVVVQDLDYTREMLEAWRDCPKEGRWDGCARWKMEWSHEQRAFSEFVRYEFNPDGDNIVTIPCDDAMSFPGMAAQYQGRIATDCNGTFFRHHTLNKERAKASVATSIMQLLYGMVQDSVREHKHDIWIVGE